MTSSKDEPGSTAEWRAIGQGPDLLYEIIAWPEKKGTWDPDEFYAMGRSDWADFRAHWHHYWPELGGTCLEIGCGVGRITHVLAEDFDFVIAVDVAEPMLERAAAAVPSNVELHQVAGTSLPIGDGTVDGVFSVHVLQHLDDIGRVADSLREMYRVLRPGGTLMVHVNLASRPMPALRRIRHRIGLRRNRRAIHRGGPHNYVTMNYYTMEDVWLLLDHVGFSDLELRVFPVRSNGYPHSFWFARRSASV